jgi:hypothetical protein
MTRVSINHRVSAFSKVDGLPGQAGNDGSHVTGMTVFLSYAIMPA